MYACVCTKVNGSSAANKMPNPTNTNTVDSSHLNFHLLFQYLLVPYSNAPSQNTEVQPCFVLQMFTFRSYSHLFCCTPLISLSFSEIQVAHVLQLQKNQEIQVFHFWKSACMRSDLAAGDH